MLPLPRVEGICAALVAAAIVAFAPVAHAAKVKNAKPIISGAPAMSANVGVAYRFTPSASDADGDRLTFSIVNKPAWVTFDPSTGALSGTPAATGVHKKIKIVVSDGRKRAKLAPFTITVGPAPVVTPPPVNRAPTISGSPATQVTAGQAYAFQATAADADGDTLRFGIANKPAWATFDIVSGRLSGTPTTANVGDHANIVVSVSDGTLSATLPAFTLTVVAPPPVNRAPTISGSPATQVTAGQAYVFQATASDPDGDVLRFGIANKPAWATFDIVSGRLSGTPTTAQVGDYANIVVSVSDGALSATLPAFKVTVVAPPPATSKAELTWTAPTQNEDGSALTNLAGYKIRYGKAPGELTQVVTIASPSIMSAEIEGLAAGTWYFSMTSYTNTGVESAPTGTVQKTVM